MDTLGIVDDSGHGIVDNYDMGKGAGSSAGGRVHSIDVILGFTKDQETLLHSVGGGDSPKDLRANAQDPEKLVQTDPFGHLPELGDSSQHAAYHGESVQQDAAADPKMSDHFPLKHSKYQLSIRKTVNSSYFQNNLYS